VHLSLQTSESTDETMPDQCFFIGWSEFVFILPTSDSQNVGHYGNVPVAFYLSIIMCCFNLSSLSEDKKRR